MIQRIDEHLVLADSQRSERHVAGRQRRQRTDVRSVAGGLVAQVTVRQPDQVFGVAGFALRRHMKPVANQVVDRAEPRREPGGE